jgi:hypothetical protein
MSFAEIEMKVVRMFEEHVGIDPDYLATESGVLLDNAEALDFHVDAGHKQEVIDEIGYITISLINMCALLDVNLVDCLEAAYEKSSGAYE